MNVLNAMSEWDYTNERVLFWMDLNGDFEWVYSTITSQNVYGRAPTIILLTMRPSRLLLKSAVMLYPPLGKDQHRYECPKCGKNMVMRERKGTIDGYEWRCRTKGGENPHDVCKSIRKEVCMAAILKESEPLGGEGKIVEIEESMFGKMKYGKGKPVNGQWVFGGVERNSNKCFFRVVPNRTKEELLSVIKRRVGGTRVRYNFGLLEGLQLPFA
ncbi:uncharacterized protein TNCV_618101 [Trichonephila clavipes]|nr:uncharacterized protein TNCV_618101 [Trichonephila clavipes]